MVVDQAGWHKAGALAVPDNVTLVRLPPYSPELNRIERTWRNLKRHHLAHKTTAALGYAIRAGVKMLNQQRQMPHPCDGLKRAA